MEVSQKSNTVRMMGNLDVKDQVTTTNMVVTGNLTVNGKVIDGLEEKNTKVIHLGDPHENGCWKIELENDELIFSHKIEGEWVVKQVMS